MMKKMNWEWQQACVAAQGQHCLVAVPGQGVIDLLPASSSTSRLGACILAAGWSCTMSIHVS